MSSPIIDATNPSELAGYTPPNLTEIRNGVFMTDIDANGKTLGVLGGLSIGYKTTKEFCLGIRTSNKAGSGSWDDPFDSSTRAKHDAKIAAIVAQCVATSTNPIFRLRDGVFRTSSATIFPTGTMMIGCPGETTLLQDVLPPLVATRSYAATMLGGNAFGASRAVYAEDLIFDCNYWNLVDQLAFNESIILQGLNFGTGKSRNIAVYRAGGRLVDVAGNPVNGLEVFALGFQRQGQGTSPDVVEIENPVVEDCGPAVTCIWAHNSDSANNSDTDPAGGTLRIINPRVRSGRAGVDGIALQSNGFKATFITEPDCGDSECAFGFYRDTLPAGTIRILGGALSGSQSVIASVGGAAAATEKLIVDGTELDLTAESPSYVRIDRVSQLAIVRNCDFATARSYWPLISGAQSGVTAKAHNNTFANGTAIADGFTTQLDRVKRWENQRYDGTAVPNFEDNSLPYNGPLAVSLTERADNSTGAPQVIADGASATLALSVATYDNGLINISTDKVVGPAAGIVRIDANIVLSAVTPGGHLDVCIYKDSQVWVCRRFQSPIIGQTYDAYLDLETAAGNLFRVEITNNTGASITLDNAYLLTYIIASFEPAALT